MTNGWKIVLPVFAPLFDVLHILDLTRFCKKKSLDTTTHRVVSPVLWSITVTAKNSALRQSYEKCFVFHYLHECMISDFWLLDALSSTADSCQDSSHG